MSNHRLDEWRARRFPFEDWMLNTACSGRDMHDIFFPVSGNSHPNRAKAICSMCIHRNECLDYAFRYEIDDGIWGGLTRNERRRMRPFRLAQDLEPPSLSAYG